MARHAETQATPPLHFIAGCSKCLTVGIRFAFAVAMGVMPERIPITPALSSSVPRTVLATILPASMGPTAASGSPTPAVSGAAPAISGTVAPGSCARSHHGSYDDDISRRCNSSNGIYARG